MPRRRGNGEGGLYEDKARRLWKAVVDIGFTADGRRRQKTVTSRTKAGALAKLRELRKEIDQFGAPLDKSTTVAGWAQHWLDTVCRPKLKPNALAAYESVTRCWIVPTIGQKRVALVKPSDVRRVYQAIEDAGLSSSTARKAHNIMSGMFESARVDGMAARNVVLDVDPPKIATSNRTGFAPDEALAIIGAALGRSDGARWLVALTTGIRQSERLGVRLDAVDLDAGVLAVEWALDEVPSEHGCGRAVDGVWPCGKKRGASCPQARLKIPRGFEYEQLQGRLCLIRPKSGKPRYVPLLPRVVDELRAHIARTAHLPNPYGLLWHHDDGRPYLPREDQDEWRNVLEAAGLITAEQNRAGAGAPTSHYARHATATVLMEAGVAPKIVGEIVGHQSQAVTHRYQHVSSDAAREAMELVGQRWRLDLLPPQALPLALAESSPDTKEPPPSRS